MKTHISLILLLAAMPLFGQVADDFEDSDLLINPTWQGQTGSFVTEKGELRSNYAVANSTYYISTPSNTAINSEWRIVTKLLFNTSSVNYVDLVVMSDSMNLTKMKNGYFVRLGGATDEIALYKTKNGVEIKIIDGADNVLNSSSNQWRIVLKRHQNDAFTLNRESITGNTNIHEGNALDSEIVTSAYYGIRIKQSTATFFNRHYFDNVYAGILLKDTIAPLLANIMVVNDKQIDCYFNEDCDSLDLLNALNYSVDQLKIQPDNVILVNHKKVSLYFLDAFLPNTSHYLSIQNIADLEGNKIATVSKPFYFAKPDIAEFRQLLITELMPVPSPVVGLPDKEYIEITNTSGKYIQLQGCLVHDPTGSKSLPNLILAPDSIIVLYNIPSLNNTGDRIWLTNQNGEIIHAVNYSEDWYKDKMKKAGGWSLEMIDMGNVCAGSSNWSGSIDPLGGTPGKPNSVKGKSTPDTNAPQLLSATPLNESLIHFTFNEEIDSANSSNFTFWRNGSANDFKWIKMTDDYRGVNWQIDFIPNPDTLYEFVISGIKDCAGNELKSQHFKVQWPSFCLSNELIFNEILFNPKTGGQDFIELYNNSAKAFDLSKISIAVKDETKQYKSISKLSIVPLIVLPYQYILLCSNTTKLCERFNCKNAEAMKIDFTKMPSMPDDEGNLILLNETGNIIDSLYYFDDWHFPLLSDKEGVSLERVSFGNTARVMDNWHSAASVVGFATPGYLNSQSALTNRGNLYFSLQNKTVSPDEDGFEDLLIVNYNLPKQDYLTTITIFDTDGRLIRQWINNETLGTEGFVTWNGTDYNEQKAAIGMYILQIDCIHPDGSKIREKMSCVVAGRF